MKSLSDWAKLIAETVARTVTERFCFPACTYRLQLAKDVLSFDDAAALVPYLTALGVSHLYCSPYLKARAGCSHGYAVVDYRQLNQELGGERGFQTLVEALQRGRMGQILDVVPNHMSTAPGENLWWTDVLENGPSSPYAGYFDIDWRPVKEELQNQVLLPLLGEQYGQVLEAGELRLEYCEGAFFVRYFALRLPLDPRTYRIILTHRIDELRSGLPADSAELRELESIATALEHLPACSETDAARVVERQREKEVVKDRLKRLTAQAPVIAEFIGRNVAEFNGRPGDPNSFDRLDQLLDAQRYRLSHWKAASDEINYRRFFDINELAALSMEEPRVFEESHRLIFDLLVYHGVDGLRIDHVDGLYDPREYLRRLQWGYLRAMGRMAYEQLVEAAEATAPDSPLDADTAGVPEWSQLEPAFLDTVAGIAGLLPPSTAAEAEIAPGVETENLPCGRLPLYVVAEKILGPEEPLPEWWLVAGTTGYDFLNSVGGLFVDRVGLADLAKFYARFTDTRQDFREVTHRAKLLILRTAMSSELQLLALRINRISERHRRSRDFTLNTLRMALREILACFPVYRTYIGPGYLSERDRQVLHRAVAQAKRRNQDIDAAAFDFIRDVLLLQLPPGLDEPGLQARAMFVGRFQQVTSPVMAKGIEDTACYRYFPLASLNEVGGDPGRGPVTIEEFHRQNLLRQAKWPRSLLASTTHDTKRSEDVRARISVLSEIPRLWRTALNHWVRLNRRRRREVDGQPAPSRNDEYLLYQTLVGIWPLTPPDPPALRELVGRLQFYMEKATREAKLHTSWINPHHDYDAAVREFVAGLLDPHPKNRFLSEFRRFHEQIVDWGLYSALSQTLLKLTVPGVPDVYQGQELWDFSLVDPDNRRPVDFAQRGELLAQLENEAAAGDASLSALAGQLARSPRDPRLKLFVTWRTLDFRRRNAAVFQAGLYLPLEVQGARAKHVCAFARLVESPADGKKQMAIVIAPRLIAQLTRPASGSSVSQPPLGATVWHDTQVLLKEPTSAPLKHLFTGQLCESEQSRILVADALADFPVAVLAPLP